MKTASIIVLVMSAAAGVSAQHNFTTADLENAAHGGSQAEVAGRER